MIRYKNKLLSSLLVTLAVFAYLFLYVPIVILVLFSFNSSDL